MTRIFTVLSTVAFTLVNGETVTVERNVQKNYENFMRGNIVEGDDGTLYPATAILSAIPSYMQEEVDMTDNSCKESSDGTVFRFEVAKGSFVNVTEDMIECDDIGGGKYMGGFMIPYAQLSVGTTYVATIGGRSYNLVVQDDGGESGASMTNGIFWAGNMNGGIGFNIAGPFSSCEELTEATVNYFGGANFAISGGDK